MKFCPEIENRLTLDFTRLYGDKYGYTLTQIVKWLFEKLKRCHRFGGSSIGNRYTVYQSNAEIAREIRLYLPKPIPPEKPISDKAVRTRIGLLRKKNIILTKEEPTVYNNSTLHYRFSDGFVLKYFGSVVLELLSLPPR